MCSKWIIGFLLGFCELLHGWFFCLSLIPLEVHFFWFGLRLGGCWGWCRCRVFFFCFFVVCCLPLVELLGVLLQFFVSCCVVASSAGLFALSSQLFLCWIGTVRSFFLCSILRFAYLVLLGLPLLESLFWLMWRDSLYRGPPLLNVFFILLYNYQLPKKMNYRIVLVSVTPGWNSRYSF